MYTHHTSSNGTAIPWAPGKVVCVGRNYADHARELGNPVPTTPLLFIKPSTSLVAFEEPIALPEHLGSCHHELELAVLIGKPLTNATPDEASEAIFGYGLGLDLTLRDLQNTLKSKGHPWERAKAFDRSCPISAITPGTLDWDNATIELRINGETRQKGSTSAMITPVLDLLAHISATFTLRPGDLVLTGTPAGVGPLQPGDALRASLNGTHVYTTHVAR